MHNFFDDRKKGLRVWNGNLGTLFLAIMVTMVLMSGLIVNALEPASYANPNTGYRAVIEDDADLLTSEEKEQLLVKMQAITQYGNVAFKTISYNDKGSSEAYIKNYYREMFGENSGTVFLIDMYNRNIWIFSDGGIYRVLTKSYADTITDNVYTYASNADYYGCAIGVFEQELALLQGQKIFQPMKYVSNALLALVIALMINYFVVKIFSNSKKPSESELIDGLFVHQNLEDFKASFNYTTSRYSPQSSGSDFGGSSGGGSGGSSGSSGGGGGHSF